MFSGRVPPHLMRKNLVTGMETPSDEMSVRFSPDGRFIAFASDETGRYEVYVSPFPVTGTKTRISAAGGTLPRWSRDGRELLYLGAELQLVSVPVRTAPTLTVGAPRRLFALKGAFKWDDVKAIDGWADWDVSRDGTRFLAVGPQPANEQPLTAILDWRSMAIRKP
jgi:eukaryotic-like serine/threonine-protein kinase